MKLISSHEAFALACKGAKKPGIYLSINQPEEAGDTWEEGEIVKAAPYLKELKEKETGDFISLCVDGGGILLLDSDEEVSKLFRQTVGDDGPTKENPYDGPCRVYALTCNADGQLLTENT